MQGSGGSHTFVEIDHEIISTASLLPFSNSRGLLSVTSEGMCTGTCCQLQAKVCARITG